MIERENIPVLYVLMRIDVPDYEPGKALAQSNHAGTKFAIDAGRRFADLGHEHPMAAAFTEWAQEGDGFGTCIVLAATSIQLLTRTAVAGNMGLFSGIVTDKTYPIRDGHQRQSLSVDTCGYVFGMWDVASLAVAGLPAFRGDEV